MVAQEVIEATGQTLAAVADVADSIVGFHAQQAADQPPSPDQRQPDDQPE